MNEGAFDNMVLEDKQNPLLLKLNKKKTLIFSW
jgi:hypothetical protein